MIYKVTARTPKGNLSVEVEGESRYRCLDLATHYFRAVFGEDLADNDIWWKEVTPKSIDDAMICPYCGSEDCYEYNSDEIAFDVDCTGHYYVDCHCNKCNDDFRLYAEFEYSVIKSYTNQ
jgi:hypothetical protein